MALSAWLPLSGNINNYGLDQSAEVTSVGDLMYTAGLFGGNCFDSGDGTVKIPVGSPTKISISLWFKPTSPVAGSAILSMGDSRSRVTINGSTLTFNADSAGLAADGSSISTEIDATGWNHLVITSDGTKTGFTVNGGEVVEVNAANTVSGSIGTDHFIYIGSKDGIDGKFNGLIQDVKVYDEVISTREIKILSHGMLLNYSFNHGGFGAENLFVNSEKDVELSTVNQVNSDETQNIYADLQPGSYTLSAFTTGTWAETNDTSGVDASMNYTGLELFQLDGASVTNKVFYDMTGDSAQVTISTAGRYYLGFLIYSDGTNEASATISFAKIEAGTKRSAWCPAAGSAMYEQFDLGGTEYDVSGNELDAEISDPGPAWATDTAMYSGSYDFSNSSYIVSPTLNVNANKFTVSVWAKSNSLNNKILFGFDTAPRFNFAIIDNKFCVLNGSTLIPFGDGGTPADYQDGWHQYIIVSDGSTMTLYIDGEEIGETSSVINLGTGKLYVNGYDASSAYKFNGMLSDLRIYMTAFSSDDVYALAHNRAAMDKGGKMFAAEFSNLDATVNNFAKTGKVNMQFQTATANTVNEQLVVTGYDRVSIGESLTTAVDIIEE